MSLIMDRGPPQLVVVVVVIVVFVVVNQKLLHTSQVGESPSLWTWVHLTLGRKNLAAMTSTRLLLLRKVQVGLLDLIHFDQVFLAWNRAF